MFLGYLHVWVSRSAASQSSCNPQLDFDSCLSVAETEERNHKIPAHPTWADSPPEPPECPYDFPQYLVLYSAPADVTADLQKLNMLTLKLGHLVVSQN